MTIVITVLLLIAGLVSTGGNTLRLSNVSLISLSLSNLPYAIALRPFISSILIGYKPPRITLKIASSIDEAEIVPSHSFPSTDLASYLNFFMR